MEFEVVSEIVNGSGEDYLYDSVRFVQVELSPKGKSAFAARAVTVGHAIEVIGEGQM